MYYWIHVPAPVQPKARRRLRAEPPPDRRERLGPCQETLARSHHRGRSDDPKAAERLRRLARSILKRCSPEELLADDPSLRVVDTWPYGDVYVLEHLWRQVGLPELIGELLDNRKFAASNARSLPRAGPRGLDRDRDLISGIF